MSSPFYANSATHQLHRPVPALATRHPQLPTPNASPVRTPQGDSDNEHLLLTHRGMHADATDAMQNRRLSSPPSGTENASPNARVLQLHRDTVQQRAHARRTRPRSPPLQPGTPLLQAASTTLDAATVLLGPATRWQPHHGARDQVEDALEQAKSRLEPLLLRQEMIVRRLAPATPDEWQDLLDEIAHEHDQLRIARERLFAIDDDDGPG